MLFQLIIDYTLNFRFMHVSAQITIYFTWITLIGSSQLGWIFLPGCDVPWLLTNWSWIVVTIWFNDLSYMTQKIWYNDHNNACPPARSHRCYVFNNFDLVRPTPNHGHWNKQLKQNVSHFVVRCIIDGTLMKSPETKTQWVILKWSGPDWLEP